MNAFLVTPFVRMTAKHHHALHAKPVKKNVGDASLSASLVPSTPRMGARFAIRVSTCTMVSAFPTVHLNHLCSQMTHRIILHPSAMQSLTRPPTRYFCSSTHAYQMPRLIQQVNLLQIWALMRISHVGSQTLSQFIVVDLALQHHPQQQFRQWIRWRTWFSRLHTMLNS